MYIPPLELFLIIGLAVLGLVTVYALVIHNDEKKIVGVIVNFIATLVVIFFFILLPLLMILFVAILLFIPFRSLISSLTGYQLPLLISIPVFSIFILIGAHIVLEYFFEMDFLPELWMLIKSKVRSKH